MSLDAERLALQQALTLCQAHRAALSDALEDLAKRPLQIQDLTNIGKEDRRILDQFAYRYTRLQDDMGARLFPAVLRALGEDIRPMSVLDRLNRLEQLEWLASAEEWIELRRILNEFTHDYPESAEERFDRLRFAIQSAWRLLDILNTFEQSTNHYRLNLDSHDDPAADP
ncbi:MULTISPECIES: hypothetical protein [unclassified Thiocapsa]|uniref:hypothetical protein n=1 Tax=unclassified Thiocapsa TaxID=2641286 RepID=UPI0035ADF915